MQAPGPVPPHGCYQGYNPSPSGEAGRPSSPGPGPARRRPPAVAWRPRAQRKRPPKRPDEMEGAGSARGGAVAHVRATIRFTLSAPQGLPDGTRRPPLSISTVWPSRRPDLYRWSRSFNSPRDGHDATIRHTVPLPIPSSRAIRLTPHSCARITSRVSTQLGQCWWIPSVHPQSFGWTCPRLAATQFRLDASPCLWWPPRAVLAAYLLSWPSLTRH